MESFASAIRSLRSTPWTRILDSNISNRQGFPQATQQFPQLSSGTSVRHITFVAIRKRQDHSGCQSSSLALKERAQLTRFRQKITAAPRRRYVHCSHLGA